MQGFLVWAMVAVVCVLSGCTSKYNPEWGQEVRKPMYRGVPTLDAVRSNVRFADPMAVPQPKFRTMVTVAEEERTGTVYEQFGIRIAQFANGYSQLHEDGVRQSSCSPIDTVDAVSYAGLVDVMRSARVVAPRCPRVADNNNWVEMTEVAQASGKIFPLAVGNRLAFSGRLLTRSDSGVERSSPLSAVTRNPLTDEEGRIVSEREAVASYVFEVVSRLPSYQTSGGKDVGEIYVIRKTVTFGDAAPLNYDVYFSTGLNWPVLIKQGNGINIKAINWE